MGIKTSTDYNKIKATLAFIPEDLKTSSHALTQNVLRSFHSLVTNNPETKILPFFPTNMSIYSHCIASKGLKAILFWIHSVWLSF